MHIARMHRDHDYRESASAIGRCVAGETRVAIEPPRHLDCVFAFLFWIFLSHFFSLSLTRSRCCLFPPRILSICHRDARCALALLHRLFVSLAKVRFLFFFFFFFFIEKRISVEWKTRLRWMTHYYYNNISRT